MANIRYIMRLVGAFLSRFRALILLGIILGIVFFFSLKLLIPALSGAPTKTVGLTGRYTVSTLPNTVLSMVGDGLTKLSKDGSVEPGIASSWETPDKGKTWIFTLEDGLSWQDGKAVKSSGINYEFSDVTVEHPDDKTVVFKLQNPYSAFPSVVSKPVFEKGLLGTGKWEVKKLSLSGSYIDEMTLVDKAGNRLIYKFYPTEERMKLAFQLGEVDDISGLFSPDPFDTWAKAKVTGTVNTGEYVAVFFNTQSKELSDKSFRQALSYAINKEALGGERSISPISKDSWAYNSQVKPYDYDPKKAKDLVQGNPEVELTAAPVLLPQAEKIARDWEAVGVKVNLKVVATIPSNYQALLAIFDVPDDPDQYSVWHSTQVATNITHYQNPRIDKLLEDGRSQIDLEERKKTYLDFQRYLLEDAPAAFLYYPETFTVSRN